MAGEYQYADTLIQQALTQAESDNQMSSDAMRRAILSAILNYSLETGKCVSSLLDEIDYLVDNLKDEEQVVTRGC